MEGDRQMKCSKCGAEISGNTKFCTKCGAELTGEMKDIGVPAKKRRGIAMGRKSNAAIKIAIIILAVIAILVVLAILVAPFLVV